MAKKSKDDPKNLSALGRTLLWVDKPGSVTKLILFLVAICAIAALADLTYTKHGHFAEEEVDGFFGFFGFVAFTMVILGARGLRVLVGVAEDYYGDKAVDAEDSYPADQIEIKDHQK